MGLKWEVLYQGKTNKGVSWECLISVGYTGSEGFVNIKHKGADPVPQTAGAESHHYFIPPCPYIIEQDQKVIFWIRRTFYTMQSGLFCMNEPIYWKQIELICE